MILFGLACACTRTPEPAAAPVEAAVPVAPASDAPVKEASRPPAPVPVETPVEAKSQPAEPRACEAGERLDTGCECRGGGTCFDICCGEDARCAHPAQPGGESACLLATPPAAPKKQQRACKDGEALADGCRCDGKTCMDLCCVGSACSHHASPDGGWAKCMKIRR